ncbi:hypothetical protein Q7C36_022065 [Tachysurus vachellii]|uniref:Uncharacterized protein n=1 Tax=Tachysurus vachellii TaxID=175792 RepID=A0AA88J3A7_TACVA|nr:hypothetical protein Q7C36_022065 [Tachysurus vachellii]
MEAVSGNWNEGHFEDYKAQLSLKQNCLSAWELIELVGMGTFTKGITTSMGISEVFQELILDVLKQNINTEKKVTIKNNIKINRIQNSRLILDRFNSQCYEQITTRLGACPCGRRGLAPSVSAAAAAVRVRPVLVNGSRPRR